MEARSTVGARSVAGIGESPNEGSFIVLRRK